ncbi:MAG: hypothetical protein EOM25_12020 [Deltaproteobacteria bacterium]|nr:hypothetical protein [Deltaproteobacteria bacterium]
MIMRIISLLAMCIVLLSLGTALAGDEFTGTSDPIPDSIRRQMTGKTWKPECPVSLDQLAYVRVSHWGFDNRPHVGELIVNKAIADNTISAFRELFAVHFPIESMKLPSSRP